MRLEKIDHTTVVQGARRTVYSYAILQPLAFLRGDVDQVVPSYRKRFPVYDATWVTVGGRHPDVAAPLAQPLYTLKVGSEVILFVDLPTRDRSTGSDDIPSPLRAFGPYVVVYFGMLPAAQAGRVVAALQKVARAAKILASHRTVRAVARLPGVKGLHIVDGATVSVILDRLHRGATIKGRTEPTVGAQVTFSVGETCNVGVRGASQLALLKVEAGKALFHWTASSREGQATRQVVAVAPYQDAAPQPARRP